MNELDCVKLIKPFKELKVGTKGCIVLKYTENDFEVEFFNENDETIDIYTISRDYLDVYWTPKDGYLNKNYNFVVILSP